jgi:hypothetical protein
MERYVQSKLYAYLSFQHGANVAVLAPIQATSHRLAAKHTWSEFCLSGS